MNNLVHWIAYIIVSFVVICLGNIEWLNAFLFSGVELFNGYYFIGGVNNE